MAADYTPDKIRNVVLLGHSHDGKTSIAEAMMFASGGIARMGSTDQNTATMDFEPEEHKRKISINLGVGFAEHNGFKINILDAPGFLDFAGQAASGLRAAEGAIVVVGPSDHLAVGTEVAARPEAWGDVILARKETPTSYHLSVVIDDALQDVTDVVRGEDLFWSTSVHRLLQHLLGLPQPVYRHHPLVRDETGQKLSKSTQATGLRELRGAGATPAAIRRLIGLP